VGIFLLVALPQEILFRGTILTYIEDAFQWPPALVIGASSLLFGAAHLNNPPNVGWYFALATLAGIFYARVFLATRNVTASAAVHAAVNWLWWLLFRG
jgi:membrane protease YdiL (CAAX protease family)